MKRAPALYLPPGQVATRSFPVIGEKPIDACLPPLVDWRLALGGLVTRQVAISFAEFLALPQRELRADIHCVTGWSRLGMTFTGLSLASFLMELRVEALPDAHFVRFVSYSARGHDTSLPLGFAIADTWLVHSADGRPLAPEHGYPLRTVTPSRYFYKSLKWISLIEFMAEDRLGYWERESSYHNNADPRPGDERYTTGSHDPREVERFLVAASYVPYRVHRNMLLSVDLTEWAPSTRDIGNIFLKDCNLRRARLDGAFLRKANLTRCDLRGASLVGTDLREADLEGASFVGANLTGADLRGSALSATRFFERDPEGMIVGASTEGMRWEGATGLLEEQESFLQGKVR